MLAVFIFGSVVLNKAFSSTMVNSEFMFFAFLKHSRKSAREHVFHLPNLFEDDAAITATSAASKSAVSRPWFWDGDAISSFAELHSSLRYCKKAASHALSMVFTTSSLMSPRNSPRICCNKKSSSVNTITLSVERAVVSSCAHLFLQIWWYW